MYVGEKIEDMILPQINLSNDFFIIYDLPDGGGVCYNVQDVEKMQRIKNMINEHKTFFTETITGVNRPRNETATLTFNNDSNGIQISISVNYTHKIVHPHIKGEYYDRL